MLGCFAQRIGAYAKKSATVAVAVEQASSVEVPPVVEDHAGRAGHNGWTTRVRYLDATGWDHKQWPVLDLVDPVPHRAFGAAAKTSYEKIAVALDLFLEIHTHFRSDPHDPDSAARQLRGNVSAPLTDGV